MTDFKPQPFPDHALSAIQELSWRRQCLQSRGPGAAQQLGVIERRLRECGHYALSREIQERQTA